MKNPFISRTVLFFTATRNPTEADYAAEQQIIGNVTFIAPEFAGQVPDTLPRCDAVAASPGVSIPEAFAALPNVTPNLAAVGESLTIFPTTSPITMGASATPIQLSLVAARLSTGGEPELVNLSADANTNWQSSATGVVTVSSTGLLTRVGAGSATITARRQIGVDDEENPIYSSVTATRNVTVTA